MPGAGSRVSCRGTRMNEVLLETKKISKSFGALLATDGVDFDVREGETHAVIGPNEFRIFFVSKRILFIDIGCGPYTSGFAFLYYTRLLGVSEILTPLVGGTQLEYYAFDNADSIQNLGARLLTAYETAENDGLFHFQTKTQYSDFKDIPSLITDADSETSIILNCCYFFASKTIDITTFVTSIQSLLDNNPKAKILLLYQNPADYTGEISQNFINFKQAIKGLKSESGKIAGLRYSYDDEFKSTNWATLKLTLNFEILKNY